MTHMLPALTLLLACATSALAQPTPTGPPRDRWLEGGLVADYEYNFTNHRSWGEGAQVGAGGNITPNVSVRIVAQVPAVHHTVQLSQFREPQVNQDYAVQTPLVAVLAGYQFGKRRVRFGLLTGGGVMRQRRGYADTPVGGTPHATLNRGTSTGLVGAVGAEVEVLVGRSVSVVPQMSSYLTLFGLEYPYPRTGVTVRWHF